MTTFTSVSLPQIAPPDPSKHVDYQLGMVLGVDDFVQEFSYSSGRDKRIVRDLIGYGVVSGLRVTVDVSAAGGPQVQVAPGELVTPSGQFVCISPAQCANLNAWLQANVDQIEQIASPPPATLALSVVASYAECFTDTVPIPGEPCRSDDELQQPSRIQDSFALDLQLSAPPQTEDDAIADFVRWVRRIPLVDTPPGDVDAFIEELRLLMALEASSPPSPPSLLDFLYARRRRRSRSRARPPASTSPRCSHSGSRDLRARVRSQRFSGRVRLQRRTRALDDAADSLRIAELTVPLVIDALTGSVIVADTPPITVSAGERRGRRCCTPSCSRSGC